MRHRTIYVYERRDGGSTVHWKPGCPLGFYGHRSRLHAFDREHPLLAHLAGERPEVVVLVLAGWFDAQVCVHCIPVPVLERLGLERPDGARAGTVVPAA